MIGNYKAAVQNLRRSRWRTTFTMMGIIIGITSVVTIVSLGEGLKQQVATFLLMQAPQEQEIRATTHLRQFAVELIDLPCRAAAGFFGLRNPVWDDDAVPFARIEAGPGQVALRGCGEENRPRAAPYRLRGRTRLRFPGAGSRPKRNRAKCGCCVKRHARVPPLQHRESENRVGRKVRRPFAASGW